MEASLLHYLIAILQIIAIDVLLGGDNAVVIALACRRLPEEQRRKGIMWGVLGAILLRIALIFCALQLLQIPWLKSAGALMLVWIGIKLLQPEDQDEHDSIAASTHLLGAIKTIVIADAVMSMDNVVAVAGAAKGHLGLVTFGILVSVPIIVWGSNLVLRLMDRFPVVITLGGGLLGWIAGEMLVTDTAFQPRLQGMPHWFHYLAGAAGALLVVAAGKLMAWRAAPAPAPLHELPLSDQGGEKKEARKVDYE